MMTPGALRSKRALIVGGGSGIGRAVTQAYRAAGAAVAILEHNQRKADHLTAELPGCLSHQGDARSLADCEFIIERCREQFGGLDIVVSCVGIFDFYRGIRDINGDYLEYAFDEIMSVNVLGQLMPVKAALGALQESRGTVILTGSSSSFYPGRGGALYIASKYAVRGCVAALAHELAPDIRVNGVAPGRTTGTQVTGPQSLGMDALQMPRDSTQDEDLCAQTPLQLTMTPDDHAGSYIFLASDAARGMTGTFIHSDGGMAVRG